jgi:voltage-gated potassium channel
LITLNGLHYVLSSASFLVRTPELRKALEYVGSLDLLEHQSYAAGFSLIFGVMSILAGAGLFKRLRIAWYWTAVFLALLITLDAIAGDFGWTFGFTIAVLAILLVFRRRFKEAVSTSGVPIALVAVVFASLYGVVGTYILRTEFNGVHSWVDAFYFTVVTYSTVGYGDITPVSPVARLFSTTMILFGLSSFATAMSVYLGPLLDKQTKGVVGAIRKIRKKV